MHAFRSYIFAARIACDSGPTCIKPELLSIEELGIGILEHFSCCDLDLEPMTFIYELDPYPLEI